MKGRTKKGKKWAKEMKILERKRMCDRERERERSKYNYEINVFTSENV